MADGTPTGKSVCGKLAGSWKTAHPGATLHESWVPNAGTEVMSFSGDLLHYSYHSTEDHQRQLAKFSILGASMPPRLAGQAMP